MRRKKFVSLINNYLKGKLSENERTLVDRWFSSVGEEEEVKLDPLEEVRLERRYLEQIKLRMSRGGRITPLVNFNWKYLSVAACFLLVCLAGAYMHYGERLVTDSDILSSKTYSNADGISKLVTLADGSTVVLAANSSIAWMTSKTDLARNVHLKGTAFFEVTHNPQKPFIVHTQNLTTKVLGTSFGVTESTNGDVQVTVRTGKVSVSESPVDGTQVRQQVVLTPNQQVVYKSSDRKLVARLVERPEQIRSEALLETPTLFQQAPVSEIFEAMESLYGVPIEYDPAQFSGCKVTTSIEEGDLYNRLDIVCDLINATYSSKGLKVVITGSGSCEKPLPSKN